MVRFKDGNIEDTFLGQNKYENWQPIGNEYGYSLLDETDNDVWLIRYQHFGSTNEQNIKRHQDAYKISGDLKSFGQTLDKPKLSFIENDRYMNKFEYVNYRIMIKF